MSDVRNRLKVNGAAGRVRADQAKRPRHFQPTIASFQFRSEFDTGGGVFTKQLTRTMHRSAWPTWALRHPDAARITTPLQIQQHSHVAHRSQIRKPAVTEYLWEFVCKSIVISIKWQFNFSYLPGFSEKFFGIWNRESQMSSRNWNSWNDTRVVMVGRIGMSVKATSTESTYLYSIRIKINLIQSMA